MGRQPTGPRQRWSTLTAGGLPSPQATTTAAASVPEASCGVGVSTAMARSGTAAQPPLRCPLWSAQPRTGPCSPLAQHLRALQMPAVASTAGETMPLANLATTPPPTGWHRLLSPPALFGLRWRSAHKPCAALPAHLRPPHPRQPCRLPHPSLPPQTVGAPTALANLAMAARTACAWCPPAAPALCGSTCPSLTHRCAPSSGRCWRCTAGGVTHLDGAPLEKGQGLPTSRRWRWPAAGHGPLHLPPQDGAVVSVPTAVCTAGVGTALVLLATTPPPTGWSRFWLPALQHGLCSPRGAIAAPSHAPSSRMQASGAGCDGDVLHAGHAARGLHAVQHSPVAMSTAGTEQRGPAWGRQHHSTECSHSRSWVLYLVHAGHWAGAHLRSAI